MQSFFKQLYADTHTFIEEQVEKLGGKDNVCLIEVGCGTGETVIPLASSAKYCIGIDINEVRLTERGGRGRGREGERLCVVVVVVKL